MRKESAETSDNKLKQMTKQERSKAMEQLKKKKKSHKREANKYAKSHGAKSRSLVITRTPGTFKQGGRRR
jgi:hypothetical protein